MGLLDIYARTSGINEPAAQTQTRTLGERAEATFDATFSPGRYFNIVGAQRDAWQRSIDEIAAVGGPKLANPYMPVTTEEIQRLGNQPAVEAERRNKVIEAARAAREQYPDLYDPENIDRYIGEEDRRRQEKADSYVGTGNGIGNFLVGAGLETLTPHGLVGLAIPVTRLPLAASSAIGRTFLGNVAKEAAFQAGANAGLQAIAEGLDYASRSQLGNAPGLGDMLANVAGAAVVGGAIGGGIRALHLKWLGLPEKVRMEAPLEVRDAFRAIEADALYSGQNRLGIDSLLHERFVEQSMDPILRGRMPDFTSLSRGVDTPFTALGSILRQEPTQIRADIAGLGNTMDRVRALPDTEIESLLREVRPDAFKQIDDIARREADLDARVAQIKAELNQIGLPEVVDLDTAARLQDIEAQLAKKGLRKQTRLDLEREREMISQSVDPQGRLADELKTLRAEFFPEQQTALKEIAEARKALDRERKAAESMVTREIEQARKRLEGMSVGRAFADEVSPEILAREFGAADAPGLAEALQRAEILRQARVVRELLPEGIAPRLTPAADMPAPAAGERITPEMQQALDSEVARIVEARGNMEISVGDRTMRAADALDEADRLAKDAQSAMRCAMGAPI